MRLESDDKMVFFWKIIIMRGFQVLDFEKIFLERGVEIRVVG